ncbi:hypothetical protein AVEN_188027-1 [Araneus ventricosus]|uniref:Uncharacterized protein n=1 Tax=Araneus ventricosus TaxID=182803 RepID=A0A4Y2S1T1_ARAVE|nr:hypothetical protein AVEN_188027-1 [Araneus ventricosus]
MDEHGAVFNVESFRVDFSLNVVIIAVVLNQLFGMFLYGCRDVDAIGDIPQNVLKSYLNFLVQKPSADESVTRKVEARAPSKASASYICYYE